MTLEPRDWLRTFADPAVLSDLRRAAHDCMRQVCDDPPDRCECVQNMMTPDEFVAWIIEEIAAADREPVRFEKGYRPKTRNGGEQLNLALAG